MAQVQVMIVILDARGCVNSSFSYNIVIFISAEVAEDLAFGQRGQVEGLLFLTSIRSRNRQTSVSVSFI